MGHSPASGAALVGATRVGDEAVRALGQALAVRVDEVIARMQQRVTEKGQALDDAVERSFTDIARVSTRAFAQWVGGASAEVAREVGRDSWRIMGQLAATREAPLDALIKRQLQWRDSVADVLREHAARTVCSDAALDTALAMLQRSLDVTLVRVGGSFESERRRTLEELARRERDLTFLATHDALTGLPNRALLLDRLGQMLGRATRAERTVAVVFLDVDNFKSINDSLGHSCGDELLCALAGRLDGVMRAGDTLGRLGGDEFVIVADDLTRDVAPAKIAQRLLDVLAAPFVLSGRADLPLTVSASLGIAVGERDRPEDLLRDADIAMYRAKREGKNRFMVFEPGMALAVQSHLELEMDLHTAVAEEQFRLVYQPIFTLSDMRPSGMEALLRWEHPIRGVVSPLDFIPTLEDSGLICEVGRWVLDQACQQAAAWHRDGTPVGISVNVSGRQLDSDALIDDVRGALEVSGLAPGSLTLEITETTLMRDADATARRLALIKALGVRIAIDDFGTGYSSLAHLQQFPIDSLKIDRSFINRMLGSADGDTLIRTLVQLGKELAIETLAEGIEHDAQLTQLLQHNCDSGQGYFLARPLGADAAGALLRDADTHGAAAPARRAT